MLNRESNHMNEKDIQLPLNSSGQGHLTIVEVDNMAAFGSIPDDSIELVYIDPPFNTGKKRTHHGNTYEDSYDDYMGFLSPRLEKAYTKLTANGSMFVHVDCRESHYVKVELDRIFGRESFMNEIIWAYDYGARSKRKWSSKHDTIFWYAKDPKNYVFNYDEMDRIPYMAPGLVGKEKAAKGKTPTDVWWHTIVGTNSKEKTGYPTQKPVGLLRRIVTVHSTPGSTLCDFFAGSGSFGEVGALLGRNVTLVDKNPQAVEVMVKRFQGQFSYDLKSVV